MNEEFRTNLLGLLTEAQQSRARAESEVEKWVAIITHLEGLLHQLYGEPSIPLPTAGGNGTSPYADMRVAEVAEVVLAEAGRPLTPDELAERIIGKGKVLRAAKPRDSIHTILKRHGDKFHYTRKRWSLRPKEGEEPKGLAPLNLMNR